MKGFLFRNFDILLLQKTKLISNFCSDMNKPKKKIILILLIVLLLPILFFTFREITSLSNDEELIEEIYNNQLQSILFSVNQYSDDMVRSWTLRISSILENNLNEKKLEKDLESLFRESESVKSIFVSDTLYRNQFYAAFEENGVVLKNKNDFYVGMAQSSKDILLRLYRYSESDFKKIEPVIPDSGNLLHFLFVLSGGKFCFISIDKDLFVQKTLSPKVQSVARDQFIVNISDSVSGRIVYQTARFNPNESMLKKNLWLIPGFQIGIELKGETVADLVKSRTSTNLIIFLGFAFLMLIAVWYAYRNIKKEVELAQIKSDFVSNVSHELRTPLALISMFSETLELGRVKSEEKKNEYYGIISREAGRLSNIVNKILSFSQIEAGKRNYHFKNFVLNDLLQKIYDTYKFHLSNKGFDFLFSQPDCQVLINGDEEALSEAVINLIDNAVKYSGEIKSVTLRLQINNDSALIEVEDKGIGIAKEEQVKIFEKFYRASKGLVHDTKGTGLGLSLVKHIIEAHKGRIEIESQPGEGSLFRLLIPLNKQE